MKPSEIQIEMRRCEAMLRDTARQWHDFCSKLDTYERVNNLPFGKTAVVRQVTSEVSAHLGWAIGLTHETHQALAGMAPEGQIQPFGPGDK